MAPMTAYRTPRPASDWARSAISSADCPGALVRIPRYRAWTSVLEGSAGAVELRHQLAMGQERGQPLLRRHTFDVISQAASGGFG